jgi:hypothetical protein
VAGFEPFLSGRFWVFRDINTAELRALNPSGTYTFFHHLVENTGLPFLGYEAEALG